jgi:signal-transduction protein with cAMP-binding, CBS, and nucleotidyltransferase domain
MKTMLIHELIKQHKIFQVLDDDQLDTLIAFGVLKQLAPGTTIYAHGQDSNNTFCLLLSGCAAVMSAGGQVFKNLPTGSLLGEIALFAPQRQRTVTVMATEPIELMEWNLEQVQRAFPNIRPQLFRLVWQNLQGDQPDAAD